MPGIGRRILSMPFQQDLDDRCNAFETWPRDKLFCFSCGGGPKFGDCSDLLPQAHLVFSENRLPNRQFWLSENFQEYSGHTDSRGVCGVSGNMFPSGNDRCDIFSIVVVTSWLRFFFSNKVCFNGNPSARFWMISIKVSLCGLLPGMTSLNYITCRPRFRWSNVWFLVFLAKHQRHLHLANHRVFVARIRFCFSWLLHVIPRSGVV
jgi:hypothetical protein